MIIKIVFEDNRFKVPFSRIKNIMLKISRDLRAKGSATVIFIKDSKMAELNYHFKGKNCPTDVLAFNLAEKPHKRYIESEIYVDLQVARKQARDYGSSYHEETARLCVHGLLHLLGFDDHKENDKKKMWQLQESYLKGVFNGNK